MRRRKRRFVLCAMITIIVSLFVNATLAYFTTENRARNVITTGTIQVDLIEEGMDGSDPAFLAKVADKDRRLSLIDKEGNVLFDSDSDVESRGFLSGRKTALH